MNCRTCQYELSQCLDGRLPSGRRAVVMEHSAGCDACARFWTELQHAQELILQLPRQRVGSGFREQLFARIQAGEGTPLAVFQEPVPIATKARYALSGALAAAAMLLLATLVRNQRSEEPERRGPLASASTEPMTAPPSGAHALVARQPDSVLATDPIAASSMMGAFKPVTTDLVAVEAAKQFEKRFAWTNQNLARLELAGDDEFAVREVCDGAVELKGLGELLLDLHNEKRLSFNDPQVDADLRVVVAMLGGDRLQKRCLDTVRLVVAPALRCGRSLGELKGQLQVRPNFDLDGQLQELLRLSRIRPEVFGQLFFVLPMELSGFEELDPRSRTFVFRDACGPIYVAPRSELDEKSRHWIQIRQLQDGGLRIEMRPTGRAGMPAAGAPAASDRANGK